MKRLLYSLILYFILFITVIGQSVTSDRFVQVSGIITDETNRPVPGVAVISKKLKRGAVSEWSGIYSITSIPGDTVFFRALGFKRYHTIIPTSFEERHCLVDIVLEADTISIEEVTILPWKTYHEFIQDITQQKPVDPLIENMNDNIASIYVAIANETGVKVSPEAGYRYAMEQNFGAMATKNQYPINNLFNPFAWAKFVDGLKHGLFKNQKFDKPTESKVRKKTRKSQKK